MKIKFIPKGNLKTHWTEYSFSLGAREVNTISSGQVVWAAVGSGFLAQCLAALPTDSSLYLQLELNH